MLFGLIIKIWCNLEGKSRLVLDKLANMYAWKWLFKKTRQKQDTSITSAPGEKKTGIDDYAMVNYTKLSGPRHHHNSRSLKKRKKQAIYAVSLPSYVLITTDAWIVNRQSNPVRYQRNQPTLFQCYLIWPLHSDRKMTERWLRFSRSYTWNLVGRS